MSPITSPSVEILFSPHLLQDWEKVKGEHERCSTALDKLHYIPMAVKDCSGIMHTIMRAKDFKKEGRDMCLNMYDIRLTDTSPSCGLNWPPEMHAVTAFLDVSLVTSYIKNGVSENNIYPN